MDKVKSKLGQGPYLLIKREDRILWSSQELPPIIEEMLEAGELKEGRIDIFTREYRCLVFELDFLEAQLLVLEDRKSNLVLAYERIIEALNDGVLLTDSGGRILVYNRAMEELERKNKEDMLGKNIWEAYGYNDPEKSEHMMVQRSGEAILEKYSAHAYSGGTPIYKSYSTVPIKNEEGVWGVYSISKDESKLRALLTEISELRRQFSQIKGPDKRLRKSGTRYGFSDIVGSSQAIKKLIKEAQSLAWLDNSILLVGDTGTGKEVFAQSIHNFGKRREEPFIAINCSAIPENLLESILFGSVKGAYTGALDSAGLFEEAGQGTIFLDEINSMSQAMQTKLLRVLQEKTARRLGANKSYEISCRVLSAMNEDPYRLIEKKKLRQDLFYRIAGYNLYIPRLVDREDDIFELADHFIHNNNTRMNREVKTIDFELRELMKSHGWPGNVRELSHFIESLMINSDQGETVLGVKNIPDYIKNIMNIDIESQPGEPGDLNLQERLDLMERRIILEELEKHLWNVKRTAQVLGLTRQSMVYRMRKLGIHRPE